LEVELVVVRTSGDRLADVSLARVGGKGLFIKELEEALERGEIDLAIHSLKDMPAELPEGFALAAVTTRADVRDVLILREDVDGSGADAASGDEALALLAPGTRVGTGSLRRRAQIAARRPDVETVPIRGNIDTRVEKVRRGDVDAVVLAAAGLGRLGVALRPRPLEVASFLPAPGQGALAVESRAGDAATQARVSLLNDPAAAAACAAERAFLRDLGASCVVPVAAFATANVARDALQLDGLVASLDGKRIVRGRSRGSVANPEAVGSELASRLCREGAREILDEIERDLSSQG